MWEKKCYLNFFIVNKNTFSNIQIKTWTLKGQTLNNNVNFLNKGQTRQLPFIAECKVKRKEKKIQTVCFSPQVTSSKQTRTHRSIRLHCSKVASSSKERNSFYERLSQRRNRMDLVVWRVKAQRHKKVRKNKKQPHKNNTGCEHNWGSSSCVSPLNVVDLMKSQEMKQLVIDATSVLPLFFPATGKIEMSMLSYRAQLGFMVVGNCYEKW